MFQLKRCRFPFSGVGPDAGGLAGAEVPPRDAAVLALAVDQVGVGRVDPADEAVAAADDDPVLVDRPVARRGSGSGPPQLPLSCRPP